MLTKLMAGVIKFALPAKSWYRAAFLATKYYAKVSKAPAGSWVRERYPNSFRLNHATKLETLLHTLYATAPTAPIFPIPVRAVGEALERFERSGPNGLLICTVHTPLNLAGVRYFTDKGLVLDGIIARHPPAEGYFTIPGTSTRIPALTVDRTVLLKAKGILRRGGMVITSVDNLVDGQFSLNQFQLAEKLKSTLMLVIVDLQPDGIIRVTLLETLDFASTTDALLPKIDAMNQKALRLMDTW